ncbi:MAG: hypothetical protein P8O76_06965 [Methylophilaceae bacterium]|nr:hypothetical protein [Methylophilaceae bacterium]
MSNPLIPKRDYTELAIKRINFHCNIGLICHQLSSIQPVFAGVTPIDLI